jgi:hypothetical protein
MNHINKQVQTQSKPQRTTAAFGYNHSSTATLRLSTKVRYGTRPAQSALQVFFQAILRCMVVLNRPELRREVVLEAFRSAFAGLVIFGGGLFLFCNLAFGIAYIATWMAYGVSRRVVKFANEAPWQQKVLAQYEISATRRMRSGWALPPAR